SRTAAPEVWVISPEEELLNKNMVTSMADPERGVTVLLANLGKFAWTRQFKQLETPGKTPPLTLEVKLIRPIRTCQINCEYLGDDVEHAHPYVVIGSFKFPNIDKPIFVDDIVTFDLTRDSDNKDWYIYLFDISPDGRIGRIFPIGTANEDEARLSSGKKVNLN